MKSDLGPVSTRGPAQFHRAVPILYLVAGMVFFFAYLFNFLVSGLHGGTRDGAIFTVWFCTISGTGLLLLGIYLTPAWWRARRERR